MARRLALAIGLLFGLIGSQLPEFAQQYRQRLGGALDELNRIVAQFDAEAAGQSLTRTQGIERLLHNDDPLARQRGADISDEIDRASRLQRQQIAFLSAGPLRRLAVMALEFDATTAQEAVKDFEPAAPVTVEALVIAGVGLLFGWSATHLCAWPIRRRLRARQADRRARAV